MTSENRHAGKRGLTSIQCCKNCTKRHRLCHSNCEDYLSEKTLYEQYKKDMLKAKEIDAYIKQINLQMDKFYAMKPARFR